MTKTILAVLAHPDDESFGLGGTLALYAQKGYDTYYICATRGEVGSVDAKFLEGFKDIAELRTDELMRAAKYLGLKDVFFLDYRDSGMPGSEPNQHPDAQINHSLDEVAGRVVKYIRDLKPDVVITFDPIGGYKHPDHIHIHNATVLAFEKADDASFHPEAGAPFQPGALYFQVFSRGFLRWSMRLMTLFGKDPTKFGRNGDINIKELAEVSFPIHVSLNVRSAQEAKRLASACHASQIGPGQGRGLWGIIVKLLGLHDDFMQAYPAPKSPKRRHDLFDYV